MASVFGQVVGFSVWWIGFLHSWLKSCFLHKHDLGDGCTEYICVGITCPVDVTVIAQSGGDVLTRFHIVWPVALCSTGTGP